MDWLALTFLGLTFRAIYGVLTKVFSNKVPVSAYTQGTLLSLFGAMLALIVSPFLGGLHFDFSNVSISALILLMISQGIGNVVYFEALNSLANSTAQITFSSILVFNTLLSFVFLNLHLSLVNFLGVLLLMAAILSVITGKIEFNKRGVGLMLAAAFLFSVFQLASAKVSKQIGAPLYLLLGYLGAGLVSFLMKSRVVADDLRKSEKRLTFGIPLLTAIPSITYFAFAYYAYRNAPQPAKVAMLLTAQVVVTVVLSYFFLREKDHVWRKLGAAILVVVAAVLIKR